MRRKLKFNEIIEVEWDDAATLQGWHSERRLAEDDGLSPCKTVGYFLRETKKSVQFSKSISPDGDTRCDTESIPKDTIRKIRRLN